MNKPRYNAMAALALSVGITPPCQIEGFRPRQHGPTDPATKKQIERRRAQRKAAKQAQKRNRQ